MWIKYASVVILQLPLLGLLVTKASSEILREIVVSADTRCFLQTQDGRTLDLTPICAHRGPDTLLVTNPLHPMYGQLDAIASFSSTLESAANNPPDGSRRFNSLGELGSIGIEKPKMPSTQLTRFGSGLSFSRVPTVGIHEWGYFSNGGGGGGGGRGGGGGQCDTPGDTAANGSKCGGRAASEKEGGRL